MPEPNLFECILTYIALITAVLASALSLLDGIMEDYLGLTPPKLLINTSFICLVICVVVIFILTIWALVSY